MRSLCLWALVALSAAPAGAQQSTEIRGQVLLRSGEPATGVGLVVVGHPPEVVLQDHGLFTHTLQGVPADVTVRVVDAPGVEVLYPPGGQVLVPSHPDAVVTVVVGPGVGASVEAALEAELASLRATLEARGVDEEAIRRALSLEIGRLTEALAEQNAALVSEAVSGAEQAELRREIRTVLSAYVRRLKDLLATYRVMDPSRDLTVDEGTALNFAIREYSAAWDALDDVDESLLSEVNQYWTGSRRRAVDAALNETLTQIKTGTHAVQLELIDPLVTVQRQFTGDPPGSDELSRARAVISDRVPELTRATEELDRRMAHLFETLEP